MILILFYLNVSPVYDIQYWINTTAAMKTCISIIVTLVLILIICHFYYRYQHDKNNSFLFEFAIFAISYCIVGILFAGNFFDRTEELPNVRRSLFKEEINAFLC